VYLFVLLIIILWSACMVQYTNKSFYKIDFFETESSDLVTRSYSTKLNRNKVIQPLKHISIGPKNKFPFYNITLNNKDKIEGITSLTNKFKKETTIHIDFEDGKVSMLFFRDSIGNLSGPLLKFNKHGILEHNLIYDKGKLKNTIYTISEEKLEKELPLQFNYNYLKLDSIAPLTNPYKN